MPFIERKLRADLINYRKGPSKPGELCFLDYLPIMRAWKTEKRWTTVHNELKRTMGISDMLASRILAFLVFFNLHVMPYEKKMRRKNGDIR